MKKIFIAFILSTLLYSCRKMNDRIQEPLSTSFSEARYTITLTGNWTGPAFSVPSGAHFTTFVGMVHNSKAWIWKEGAPASPGTELLAEIGNGTTLLSEIDSMVTARNASSLLLFTAPATLTGSRMTSVYCNTNYPQVSFASMLGPTPDWFVGVSGISLLRDHQWINDTTVNLYPLDAGTEDGDQFGYTNPATMPQQPVHVLLAAQATVLANGNPALAPIATARFQRF